MSRLYTYSVDYLHTNIRSAYQSSSRLVACSDGSLKHGSRRDADASGCGQGQLVTETHPQTVLLPHVQYGNSLSKPVRLYQEWGLD